MMKKLLTALVVAMLLLALPVVVLAEASGTCGDNLTWTLTDDGVLSISGTGPMYNYYYTDSIPWSPYYTEIISIGVANGATSIGDNAFGNCTNLTNIQLPDSVTTIGEGAFHNCSALTSFSFPSSVTRIEASTFAYTAIEQVVIPENITYIDSGAFYGCENLTSVTLHNGITDIDTDAFYGCPSLESVYVPGEITLQNSSFGTNTIVYTKLGSNAASTYTQGNTGTYRDPDYPDVILGSRYVYDENGVGSYQPVAAGCSSTEITEVIVPEGVTEILQQAFADCTKLTSVSLPESLKSINYLAFENCTSLESIVIPDNATTIGSCAFQDCTSLKKVVMNGVTTVGSAAFNRCTSLESIEMNSVTEIQSNAFQACTGLTGILKMPETLTTLDNAFNACTNLSGILLPDHVTTAYITTPNYYANRESETALVNTQAPNTFKFIDPDYPEVYLNTYQTEDGELYYEIVDAIPTITTIDASTFPEGTTAIGVSAFSYCDKLTSVTIPESITVIPADAFYRCSQLKSVTLHDGITQLSGYAFAFSGIESIYLPGSIGEVSTWLFQGCESLKYVTLGEGITSIKDYAFGGVTTLEQIYIPSSVISIGEQSGSDVVPLPGQNVTMQFTFMGYNTDVYCYEYSYAEHWGNTVCRQAILLDGKDTDEITNVTLPESMTTTMGLPIDIPCTIFPVTNDQVVTWVSSNPAVARVDANGRVTPLKPGSTTITLTVDSASASCEVTVYPALKSLTLPETVYAVAKEGVQLPLRIIPADAACDFTYTIADANFGSISSTGWITAATYITTPSTTTLTVTDSMSGKTVTTQLCITYPVTAISFAQPTVDVACGAISLLTANVTMRSDSCVNQLVTFTSSDPAIATVDSFGYVTGLKQGSVTITATSSSGVSATCTVNITAPGLPGDVSGDQTVALDDALALLTDLIDPAVTDFPDVADVDKDTIVDQYDVLLLVQYLSGWDVELK